MAERTPRVASPRGRLITCAIALVVASAAPYAATPGYGFLQWDDMTHIVRDGYAHGLSAHNTTRVFLPLETTDYQPVRYLYHQSLYSLFGPGDAAACHVGNVLLKALVALLAFLVLRRISVLYLRHDGLLLPFFGALFFSLHPMTVEPTAWCIGVKELLAGVFYLSGLYCFLLFLEGRLRRFVFLTGVFCLLSLLSKASAISFPFVAALLLYYRERKPDWKRAAVTIGPLLVLAAAVAALNMAAYHESRVIGDVPTRARIENIGSILQSSVPVYARNLLLPLFLSPVYDPFRTWHVTDPRFAGSVLVCLALIVLSVRLVRRRHRAGLFVGWFVLAALPAFALQTNILTADRYLFLALLPASALLAMLPFGPGRSARARRIATVASVFLCAFYAAATVSYSRCFRSDKELFERALKIAPRNPTSYNNYATMLASEGQTTEAVRYFRKAAELDPHHFHSRNALGKIYSESGNFQEANRYFQEALDIAPRSAEVHWRLGRVKLELGDPDAALRLLDRAIALDPRAEEAYYFRGFIRYGRKQYDEAAGDFEKALEINPGRADTYACLGTIELEDRAHYARARELFEKAAELAPRSADPRFRIGLSYEREAKLDEAKSHFEQALALDPDEPLRATIQAHLDRIERGE